MKKVVLVMAALAVMCYALPAFSAGTCQDWKGVWSFTYDNNTSAVVCYDNSTDPISACDNDSLANCNCFDISTAKLCVDNSTYLQCDNDSLANCNCIDNPYYQAPTVAPGSYEVKITSVQENYTGGGPVLTCLAQGKRTIDDQDILIAAPDNATINNPSYKPYNLLTLGTYIYYEAAFGPAVATAPFSQILPDDFTGDNFTAREDLNVAGLVSGTFTRALTCEDLDNCTACSVKVIPDSIGIIRKIVTFTEPFKVFAIRQVDGPDFARGDKAEFDSDVIIPLIQLRISKKTIAVLAFAKPFALFQLGSGEVINVTVGDCVGTITVK